MIDHGCDHLPKAEIETHLPRSPDDGKHDADHRRDEAQAVVKQVAECEREYQGMPAKPDLRIIQLAF